jgi:type I restriction enzyme S subunit
LAASVPLKVLKRATRRIEVGIVVTPSAWYADAGVLAIRGMNVRAGGFDLSDVVYLSAEGHALHGKSALATGDVVVVRTGQAGAAAVVPDSLDGSNCIDLLIVRPGAELLPAYLEHVLNSDWTQKHIGAHSVGTIQSHFNVGAMKELPVPVPSLEVQRSTVSQIDAGSERLDSIIDRMVRQISLLREHRQALITAAVTGEIDVTKKAS